MAKAETKTSEEVENLTQEKQATVKDYEALGWRVWQAKNKTWQAEKQFDGLDGVTKIDGFFSVEVLLAEMANTESRLTFGIEQAAEAAAAAEPEAEEELKPLLNAFDFTTLSEELQEQVSRWENQNWSICKVAQGWDAEKYFEGEGFETTLAVVEDAELDGLFTKMRQKEDHFAALDEAAGGGGEIESRGQQQQAVKNFTLEKTVTRNCLVRLRTDEQVTRSEMLGAAVERVIQIKKEAKTVAAGYKRSVEDAEAEVRKLSEVCVTGKEWRDVECFERMLYGQGIVEIVRKDTLEVADTREMTQKERQTSLFI